MNHLFVLIETGSLYKGLAGLELAGLELRDVPASATLCWNKRCPPVPLLVFSFSFFNLFCLKSHAAWIDPELLSNPPASTSWVLGLQVCATAPAFEGCCVSSSPLTSYAEQLRSQPPLPCISIVYGTKPNPQASTFPRMAGASCAGIRWKEAWKPQSWHL